MKQYIQILLITFLFSVYSCNLEKSKTFEDEAMELINQIDAQNKKGNQTTLLKNDFSEGVKKIIEWGQDDYILEDKYPEMITVKTTKEYQEVISSNTNNVKAIYIESHKTSIDVTDLSVFSNLEYLKLGSFDSLPLGFYDLRNLKYFIAIDDLKCKMDERIINLSKLEEIKLHFTYLELPSEISELQELNSLILYNFNYDQPYSSIYKIPNLKTLGIRYSTEEQIDGISELKSLRTLATNKVNSEVGALNLTGLKIGENNDKTYPNELSNLTNLVAFYWQGNRIRKSPPQFVESLDKLEYLEIRGCSELDSIPQSYDSLSSLLQFDIISRNSFKGKTDHLTNINHVINLL